MCFVKYCGTVNVRIPYYHCFVISQNLLNIQCEVMLLLLSLVCNLEVNILLLKLMITINVMLAYV